jgi:hypothetical protein
MAYTVTTRTVKPANVQWWNQVDAAGATRWSSYVSSFPGVVSSTGAQSSTDANVWESAVVFENKAAQQAFQASLANHADFQARKAYLIANNIVSTHSAV